VFHQHGGNTLYAGLTTQFRDFYFNLFAKIGQTKVVNSLLDGW
jgi:hypothetical protein